MKKATSHPMNLPAIAITLSLLLIGYILVIRTEVNDPSLAFLEVSKIPTKQHHVGVVKKKKFKKQQQKNQKKKTLNIHMVPHTHDDPGWLKTVEQYYYGTNNTIQKGCVSCILDTVIKALQENPNRTFTYVEMVFFVMWWEEQSYEMQNQVRALVQNGQLSFANGGWCMHDEATTHYVGMIDQTTLGHDFLKKEFDFVPRVTWQLDPFGHSSTQASLLGSEAGFDAVYFGRIDYQDLEQRRERRDCEGIWDSSPNLNDTEIFWGLTGSYMGNYGAPEGFCFDVFCDDEPILGLNQTQLHKRVFEFMKDVKIQQSQTRGDNLLLTMGSDFQYSVASVNFNNLDLLISTINENKKVFISELFPDYDDINAFYSTPDIYTDYKYDEFKLDTDGQTMNFEVKADDFFPYSDCEHCFWTGYFTSRPALKKLERVGSSFLQVAKQVQALFTDELTGSEAILTLEKGVGLVQHHDALSGTSKQHVTNDYAKQVQAGINEASSYVGEVIRKKFNYIDGFELSNVTFCQLLNESICELPQDMTRSSKNESFYAILYNALPHLRSEIITIPVSTEGPYYVEKAVQDKGKHSNIGWEIIPSDIMSNLEYTVGSQGAPYSLLFEAKDTRPISMTLYRVSQIPEDEFIDESNDKISQGIDVENSSSTGNYSVGNGKIELDFERGSMVRIRNVEDGGIVTLHKEWGYYKSFPGSENDIPASGAYIFRPDSPDEKLTELELNSTTIAKKSSILTEVQFNYEVPWLKDVIKLYKGKSFIDIEYTVGPIDINDGVGKEVIMRLKSNIRNDGVFYTDSNAREFIKRKRSERSSWAFEEFEPVAGNFYPVNAAIYIEDDNASIAVLNDRSQGGSSLLDGSIEAMVHRRILHDDSRGVGEPLNETSEMTPYPPYGDASRKGEGITISGTFRVMIGGTRNAAALARSEMDSMFSPLHVFTASALKVRNTASLASEIAIENPFPKSLQLITMKLVSKEDEIKTYFVRLGHKYGLGESNEYSVPVKFDLSTLFKGELFEITETTLTGNRNKNERIKDKKQWIKNLQYREDTENNEITMYPMQIRTWFIQVGRKKRLEENAIKSVK